MVKVLIGSPICQDPKILEEFLLSIKELDKEGIQVDYCFIDDNSDATSKIILNRFKNENNNVTILFGCDNTQYTCDEYTHRWNQCLVDKITEFKNNIIKFALERDYDYLFFVDSDIILNPKTLKRLVSLDKEIIADIFWTKWNPQADELPQVWMKDAYTLYDFTANSGMTDMEASQKTKEFIDMLRKPGTYKVGGLGACTLISKEALKKGVNFDPVYNVSFWGEDRHFCIRAAVLGIQLYVDTYYPAYHVYRQSDIAGIEEYKKSYSRRETEVLGSKVLELIIEAIEGYGDYSYKEDFNNNWQKYFRESERVRLQKELDREKENVAANKIINKIQVMECSITFFDDNTRVESKIRFNKRGYKNSYGYYDEYEGEVLLSKENNKWIIDEFKIGSKLVLDFVPLVRKAKELDNKLTLSMVVKNESGRYLERALKAHREFIDNAVIIDDGSTDDTIEICKSILKDIPLTIIENKNSKFSNEVELRKQQWYETIATNPDWILFLDADEIFEDKFKYQVREMMKNIDIDCYIFRLFDFWDENNYRSDNLWYAHNTYRAFMIRYQKNFKYEFKESNQHCGRIPQNVMNLPYAKSELRLKHYGWSREEDRIKKYARYMLLDPEGREGSLEQYKSILDPNPILAKWNENE